eukprot:CAMPEP_0205880874 /NCGR_PEP_ID=MMETSP1083-20121108/16160_1 /ASSEMBLY_ACC=CAM_ASM_000430 /TAXON_ID=97485 /ORGANISM="Prymnesium parvum, Strain Texoma1" /LENGTH=274 /DNA_ID=CAMNT_0053243923 /DNA_START=70 /DNA_END=896 /DNA_ORIENTATION=+
MLCACLQRKNENLDALMFMACHNQPLNSERSVHPARGKELYRQDLLLDILLIIAATAAALLGDRLPLVAARAAAAIGGGGSEVDVLLAVNAHHEGRDVDNLLANADVAVTDEHTAWWIDLASPSLKTCVCRRRSKKSCERQGRDSGSPHTSPSVAGGVEAGGTSSRSWLHGALAHRRFEREHVIQLLLALVQDAQAKQPPEQGTTLEDAAPILILQGEELTSGLADARQRKLCAPHLALVLQTELANELHLNVETLLLEGTTGRARRLTMIAKE